MILSIVIAVRVDLVIPVAPERIRVRMDSHNLGLIRECDETTFPVG